MRLKTKTLAIRTNDDNVNHHIWNNHGGYYIKYTIHVPDYTKARKCEPLGTRDLETARLRRDARLNALEQSFTDDASRTVDCRRQTA